MCGHNNKPSGMPDISVVTEVAGRVCALPLEAAGRLKSLLVAIDDVVAEGQIVAIIET